MPSANDQRLKFKLKLVFAVYADTLYKTDTFIGARNLRSFKAYGKHDL